MSTGVRQELLEHLPVSPSDPKDGKLFPIIVVRRIGKLGTALIALVSLLGSLSPTAAQATKLYPIDEGRKNRSFHAFRHRLIAALRRGDRQFVLSIVDPKIIASFGHQTSGIDGFKELWNLDESGPAGWNRLRNTLLPILALGGSSVDGEFCAPYVYSKWPNHADSFEYAAIVGRRVAVRLKPAATAPILTRLTYDIVKIPTSGIDGGEAWVKINTPTGRRGYVAGRYLRSPIDYRACFRQVKEKWWMTALVAGD